MSIGHETDDATPTSDEPGAVSPGASPEYIARRLAYRLHCGVPLSPEQVEWLGDCSPDLLRIET
jgi:hypothetical protein